MRSEEIRRFRGGDEPRERIRGREVWKINRGNGRATEGCRIEHGNAWHGNKRWAGKEEGKIRNYDNGRGRRIVEGRGRSRTKDHVTVTSERSEDKREIMGKKLD